MSKRSHPINYRSLFEETKNPFIPLEVFVYHHHHGKPVPKWVASWFAQAFEKFLNVERRPGLLEHLLGFSGKGNRSPEKKLLIRFRDRTFLDQVLKLKSLGVNPDTAIKAVIEKFSSEGGEFRWPSGEIIAKCKSVHYSYLRRKYYSYKKSHPEEIKAYGEITSQWSPGERKKFIEQYPLLNSGFKVT